MVTHVEEQSLLLRLSTHIIGDGPDSVAKLSGRQGRGAVSRQSFRRPAAEEHHHGYYVSHSQPQSPSLRFSFFPGLEIYY